MNFQTICRICIRENSDMLSIFESYNFSKQNYEIFKVITDCASVEIQRLDGFSEQICRGCLDHLSQAFSFKKLCEDSDYKFRNDLIVADKIQTKNNFCKEHPKIANDESDSDQYGIEEKEIEPVSLCSDVFENMDYQEPDGLNNSHCIENDTSKDPAKSFVTMKHLAFHMRIHTADQPKLCEESDDNLRNNLIVSQEIEIKSESFEEDTEINFGENQNHITENTNGTKWTKMTDVGLIEVNKENYNDEIKTQDIIEIEDISPTTQTFEFINCEAPSILMDLLNTEKDNSDTFCTSSKHEFGTKSVTTKSTTTHKCNVCDKTFQQINDLRLHIRLHSDNSEHCNKSFSDSDSLVQHSENPLKAPPKENPYNCDLCDKKLAHKCSVADHMKTHSEEKPHKCIVCGKKFARKRHLNVHIRVHTQEKQYKCEYCDKEFTQASHLKTHVKLHTGEKPFKCKVCDQSFTHKVSLLSHMSKHTGERSFKCHYCEKTFTSNSHLSRHINGHLGIGISSREKQYKCEYCDKKFKQRSHLKTHIKLHTGEKPFKCEVCDNTFTHKISLLNHMSKHTGERAFPCRYCEKTFTSSSNLTQHLNRHLGVKPYKCDICEKTFTDSSTLTKHKRMHTGEKPYKCKFCEKTFSDSSNLVKHSRSHVK